MTRAVEVITHAISPDAIFHLSSFNKRLANYLIPKQHYSLLFKSYAYEKYIPFIIPKRLNYYALPKTSSNFPQTCVLTIKTRSKIVPKTKIHPLWKKRRFLMFWSNLQVFVKTMDKITVNKFVE